MAISTAVRQKSCWILEGTFHSKYNIIPCINSVFSHDTVVQALRYEAQVDVICFRATIMVDSKIPPVEISLVREWNGHIYATTQFSTVIMKPPDQNVAQQLFYHPYCLEVDYQTFFLYCVSHMKKLTTTDINMIKLSDEWKWLHLFEDIGLMLSMLAQKFHWKSMMKAQDMKYQQKKSRVQKVKSPSCYLAPSVNVIPAIILS